ncbi:MAG: hypothetical protein RL154_588, partial [Pseudomonadota bacterium]
MSKRALVVLGIIFAIVGFVFFKISADITKKQVEGKEYPLQLAKLSDKDPTLKAWGVNFPKYVDMYNEMQDDSNYTDFGGSLPYSKLIRYPQLTELWDGYPFAVDYNSRRPHYYSQIDQMETKRNDKEYLNSHGLPKFAGQPGACMNCHSGWVPNLVKEMGWENFNHTPYKDIVAKLEKEHGDG